MVSDHKKRWIHAFSKGKSSKWAETVWVGIWTRLTDSIIRANNHYNNRTSYRYECVISLPRSSSTLPPAFICLVFKINSMDSIFSNFLSVFLFFFFFFFSLIRSSSFCHFFEGDKGVVQSPYKPHTHTHTYIYIYIYIYTCVCVCVCDSLPQKNDRWDEFILCEEADSDRHTDMQDDWQELTEEIDR